MKRKRNAVEKKSSSEPEPMLTMSEIDALIASGETSIRIPGPHCTTATREEYEEFIEHVTSPLRKSCYYGPEYEVRTCIMSGCSSKTWKKKSSGVSWIAVHGNGGACVLSMDEEIARSSCHSEKKKLQLPVYSVLHTAIADIDGASPDSIRRKAARWSKSEGPFAVVSIAPGTVEDHAASDAINFLEKKLKNCSALTIDETAQVAVLALKFLFGSRFNLRYMQAKCSPDVRKVMRNKGQTHFFKDAYMCGASMEGETPEHG